jgi:hypothetical protein
VNRLNVKKIKLEKEGRTGMGLLDWFRPKKQAEPSTRARNVFNLQPNDIVTYDLEDYMVVGKIEYNDSGYKWIAYNLKGDSRYIWLSAEMDDELELGIYEKIQTTISSKVPEELEIEGIVYYLEEQGTAQISEVLGQAGAVQGQRVNYWDFESDNEQYLSVEKWGGDLEVSKGYPISEKEIKIIAGS